MAGYPVEEQTAGVGEDAFADVCRVEQQFNYANVSTAATTVVKSGPGFLHELLVPGGVLGNVTVYDSATASGNVIVPTVTPVANGVLIRNVAFQNGLTIVTAAATVLTISYR